MAEQSQEAPPNLGRRYSNPTRRLAIKYGVSGFIESDWPATQDQIGDVLETIRQTINKEAP